ncbi:MAG: hypothetical protein ACSLFJ_12870 [Immundisolibacter sp.]|uniref:hypothetical protein n=1 Tax=Immundisolibacter sp. TaxID=1934948 RepID=UPI003EE20486
MPQVGFDLLRRFEAADDALVLRRYVSNWKFAHLVSSKALFFAPASKFSDKLEGHYTHLDNERSDRQLVQWGFDSRARDIAEDARTRIASHNQKAVVICCWTAGCDESPRHWSKYGGSPEAVALETTVGHLRRALGSTFLIVPVNYLDFSEGAIPREHSLQPFFFKQRCFAWEREVRVVGEMEIGKRIESPRVVAIDLASTFQGVIISPTASETYRSAVKSRLGAASLSIPVFDSVLK